MGNDIAQVPYGYKFLASNYYVKEKMYWKINISGAEKDTEGWAAWRVLDGMNNFEIEHGQMVAVRGESREVDET